MAGLKQIDKRQLELSDKCDHCGAQVRYVITSRSGEFHAEKIEVEGPTKTGSDGDDKDFWEGKD